MAISATRSLPSGAKRRRAGDEGFNLGEIARGGDCLLPLRAFRKHAQIERGAGAIVEIDDDEGIVENVRAASVVALIEEIDVHGARGIDARSFRPDHEPHQIEEVAALLHQRSAGLFVEAVPSPIFVQEREAVLADGESSLSRPMVPLRTSSSNRATEAM